MSTRNTRRRGDDGEDRISGLPEDVLCHILWFLPSEEAIATSLLSTRWRFLWRMVPAFEFHCTKPTGYEKVYKFLSIRTIQRITRFRLNCHCDDPQAEGCYRYSAFVNKWFSAATNDGIVEHLSMSLCFRILFIMPDVLSCNTIISLKLKVDTFLTVPSSVNLPSLKTLDIELDICYPSSFKSFYYGSPALELFHQKQIAVSHLSDLKIVRNSRHIRLVEHMTRGGRVLYHHVIESDRDYDFISSYFEDRLENMVKVKVYITLCNTNTWFRPYSLFTPDLRKLCNVEFMSLADFRTKLCTNPDWPDTLDFPQFQNLVQLQLYLKDAHSMYMDLPAKYCPKLQVFEHVIMDDSSESDVIKIKMCPYRNPSIVPI